MTQLGVEDESHRMKVGYTRMGVCRTAVGHHPLEVVYTRKVACSVDKSYCLALDIPSVEVDSQEDRLVA